MKTGYSAGTQKKCLKGYCLPSVCRLSSYWHYETLILKWENSIYYFDATERYDEK